MRSGVHQNTLLVWKGLIGIALILPCVEVLPNMTALLRIEVAVLNHLVVPMWLLVNDDQSQYA